MPKRFRYPRNEAARRDRVAQHEIINTATRNIASRNDAIVGSTFPDPGVTIAATGTALNDGGIQENQVVTGSQTMILTLTGGVWHADIGTDNGRTDALLAAMVSDQAEAAGWAAQMLAGDGTIDHTDVARTSDTVVTITLPATASYAITLSETVTISVPGIALADSAYGKGYELGTVDLKITAGSMLITGTVEAGGVLESEIVTGSETVIFTLTGETWVATLGDDNSITTAFLAALDGSASGAGSWDDEVSPLLAHGQLVRTSDTVMTLTLPATAGYAITGDETVSIFIPIDSLTFGVQLAGRNFIISNEA